MSKVLRDLISILLYQRLLYTKLEKLSKGYAKIKNIKISAAT